MAKVFRPLNSLEARGSVAALQFQQGRHGSHASENSSARQPRNFLARRNRYCFADLVKAWRQLPEVDRQAAFAFYPPGTNVYQVLMTYNLLQMNGDPNTDPFWPDVQTFMTTPEPHATEPNHDLRWSAEVIESSPNGYWINSPCESGTNAQAYASVAQSPGIRTSFHPSKFKSVCRVRDDEDPTFWPLSPLTRSFAIRFRLFSNRSLLQFARQEYHFIDGELIRYTE